MRYRILFPLFAILAAGCQTVILGEQEPSTPENNFELFWQDFDRHYGLFAARGWDWDSIYTTYRPRVTANTSDDELFGIFKEMIAYLDDSHTYVYRPGVEFFASGSEQDSVVEKEFSLPLILDDYVEIIDSNRREGYMYGRVRGDGQGPGPQNRSAIGYLYLAFLEMRNTDVIDDILRNMDDPAAIIIDVRNNTGGDDYVGAELAGRFVWEKRLVYTVQERNGPRPNDFAGKTEYFARPLGTESFTKPVVLLTDLVTVSAAEVMINYLKVNPLLTQIGDATSGDFSDTGMNRFLPNGWVYQYSIMQFLLPDGRSLDGIGHVPDIYVRNSVADIEAGQDRVLERGLRFLAEEYGIK